MEFNCTKREFQLLQRWILITLIAKRVEGSYLKSNKCTSVESVKSNDIFRKYFLMFFAVNFDNVFSLIYFKISK